MHIERTQHQVIATLLEPGKVVLLYGPRRCGKTTLLHRYLETVQVPYRYYDGDDLLVRQELGSQSIPRLVELVGDTHLVVIDEAQRIPEVGLNLKILVDNTSAMILATGSSSFDLAGHTSETLTGRKFVLRLFPLAQLELVAREDPLRTKANLPSRLIYGSYPEVVLAEDLVRRSRLLGELVGSYLYKDVLELEGVRHADKLVRLLQLLAFQVGATISTNELGTQLGLSKNTVERYLDLLERCFVLVSLGGFSRNPRKEISKSRKYYFWDCGIRNAVIGNFNPLERRDDLGCLWENYLVTERLKYLEYRELFARASFWRTYARQELDWVEERNGTIHGYEFKWNPKKGRPLRAWQTAYPEAGYTVVHPGNYLEFITGPTDATD